MSDEALNAHLQWMDDCDKAQGMDYETWLEGKVALLEAENAALTALSELLSHLVDVELERDKLADKLRNIECAECGLTMLECKCDET